jgi:chromosome segregation ATPase
MADDEGPKKNSADGEFESSAFEALERDFQEVLQELVGDKSLERFRAEYEKLHRALKKSHEQEKRLIKRCRELNAEIVNNAAKVQTALKLSQEDQHTITSLKKEIEKAWKMVDASHEKEVRAKETIQKLKMEIANLSRLVEQGAGLSIGQDNTVQELINLRDDLKKQVEDQSGSIKQLKEHMNTLNGRVVQLEGEKDEQKHQIKELNDLVTQREAEQERDRRRKKRLDEELKDLKGQLEVRHRVSLEWVGGVGGGCFGVGCWVGHRNILFLATGVRKQRRGLTLCFFFLPSLFFPPFIRYGCRRSEVKTVKWTRKKIKFDGWKHN